MSDVQDALKKLVEAVKGSEELEKRLAEAAQAGDFGAIAAIATDLGIELDAADLALGKRKLDEGELEAVAGGHDSCCHDLINESICAVLIGMDYWL